MILILCSTVVYFIIYDDTVQLGVLTKNKLELGGASFYFVHLIFFVLSLQCHKNKDS